MIRLVLVEDDARLLASLIKLFSKQEDIQLVGYDGSAEDALFGNDWSQVDVLLTDLDLPGASGVQLIAEAVAKNPAIIALVLTIHDDRESLFSALRAGSFGYVVKGGGTKEILAAVRDASAGIAPISPAIARYLIEEFRTPSPCSGPDQELTAREIELLRYVAEGLYYKEIGEKLCISPNTVHGHIKKIYSKLHAVNRSHAIRRATALGYLKD
jgi:DNA-binding NarL/FixJ family response regulator